MIILLYGEDGFRSRQKLNEIIKEYRAKHQSGLDLVRFREGGLDFDKFKQKVEAVSMFDEKKLIILENVLKNKSFQEEFSAYVKKNKLKDNQDVIVVLYQEGKLTSPSLKRQASMFQEFKLLAGMDLVNWIKKQAAKNKTSIGQEAVKKLIAYVGNDLWQLNNELNKLICFRSWTPNRSPTPKEASEEIITEQDIDLLVKAKMDVNIFKTIDALAQRDKKTAFKLLHEHLKQGENEIYLLSMFVYQVRTLLKLKDLIEKGTPFYSLAKKAGLHPFVVKKSSEQLRNFTLDQLKRIYQRLLEIELKIKVGRIDGPTALDLLIAEI
jgi:DNA polymerase-3 subunit delta